MPAVARKRFGLGWLLAVCVGGALGACQCAGLKEGVRYKCSPGTECPTGEVCADGFCREPSELDAGLPRWDASVSWTFENPLAGARDLYAIHGRSPNDLLAVGQQGAALYWDGRGWTPVDAGVDWSLEGVWMASNGLAFAVGDAGGVLRWTSDGWAPPPLLDDRRPLHGVFGGGSTYAAIIVGDGVLEGVKWGGSRFEVAAQDPKLPDGGPPSFRGVWVSSDQRGWVVGESGVAYEPLITGQYTPSNAPTGSTLNAVFGSGANAWMVGERGRLVVYTDAGIIGGVTWDERNIGGNIALRAVTGESSGSADGALGRIWIVGEGGAIFRSDAGGYEQLDAGIRLDLNGVFSPSHDNVWAVGEHGSILHFTGGSWLDVTGGVTRNLRAVWHRGGDDLLAAGDGRALLWRTDGGWASIYANPAPSRLTALWGSDATNVWLASDTGAIVRLKENETAEEDGLPASLRGLWGLGPDDVWTVGAEGDGGVVYRYQVRTGWVTDGRAPEILNGIWGTLPIDLRAVGSGGGIYRRTGDGGWSSEENFGVALNAIWGNSPGDVWAVGNRGTLLHWAGNWTAVEKTPNADLFAVRGRSASDVWAVGARGTILHWDGVGWVPVLAPTQRDLTGIAFGEDGGVWVVGADGTILTAAE